MVAVLFFVFKVETIERPLLLLAVLLAAVAVYRFWLLATMRSASGLASELDSH